MGGRSQNQIPPTPFVGGGVSKAPVSIHLCAKKNMPPETRKAILKMCKLAKEALLG